MDSTRIAYLEMIQRAVDRMAGESARMKQFCLLSVAAVLVYGGCDQHQRNRVWEVIVRRRILVS